MSLSHSPLIVRDGLVLCLDAANPRSYPKSGTTWSDLVGANNGTMENMTSANYSSDNGGVISFDGANEYCQINNADDLINSLDITVCIWINQHSIHTNTNFSSQINLFEIPAATSLGIYSSFYLTLRSGTVSFRYQKQQNQAQLSPSSSQEINVWRNYIATSDSTSISLYKDGQSLGSNSSTYSFSSFAGGYNGVRLGEAGYYNNHYDGQIGLFQMYNRALTADEVQQNYRATKGRYK